MNFTTIHQRGNWVPIHGCPGRFVLRGAPPSLSLADLLGAESGVHQFQSPRARDPVFVVRLEDGGIISYRQSPDVWRHTLCTPEGFERKLKQLEIILPESIS